MSLPPKTFEEALWRELERMSQAMEKLEERMADGAKCIQSQVSALDEIVDDMRVSMAEIKRDRPKTPTPPSAPRSRGGRVRDCVSAATIGALITAATNWLVASTPAHPAPRPPATAEVKAAP